MSKSGRALGLLTILLTAACAPNPELAPTINDSSASAPVTSRATAPSASAPASVSSPEPAKKCLSAAAQLPIADQVGQLFMVGAQAGVAPGAVIAQLEAERIGSLILLGQRAGLANVQAETAGYRNAFPQLLIAAEQEGGQVQRLAGAGFDVIPSAAEQAAWSEAQLRQAWRGYGEQLKSAGVFYNLAPVADVVPADQVRQNAAIGQLQRGYGHSAEQVAAKTSAVISGLTDAGVATSAKHFPGLGQVSENTDFAVGYDRTSTLSDDQLRPFAQAIAAGVSSVMVSSAIYTKVDPDNPGVFSTIIIEDILRGRLGFSGVVISDDLGAAVAVADVAASERALRFFAAGGDLLISADPQLTTEMVDATLRKAQTEPTFATAVSQKTARVLALKESLGLLSCGA